MALPLDFIAQCSLGKHQAALVQGALSAHQEPCRAQEQPRAWV